MGAAASAQSTVDALQDMGIEQAKALIRDKAHLKELWASMDINGNGKVSLAEIDRMVVDLSNRSPGPEQQLWQSFNKKPALMRAYQFTTHMDGRKIDDAYVRRNEFVGLLRNLFFFSMIWDIFDDMDIEDDRRIDGAEFQAGLRQMGFDLSPDDVKDAFDEIDANNGGMILFDEFCAYCIKIADAGDESLGIKPIIYDSDSDEDDGVVKKTRKRRPVIDRGDVSDYADILGTFNQKTGLWEGFVSDTSYPTIEDLQSTMTSMKRKAKLVREEALRQEMGLPPDEFR